MSQQAANGVARTKPDALSSLIARLPDARDRDGFAALVSYIDSLPANDEFVKVAQLFGFLTLLGRELPEALAQERKEFRELLSKAYTALQQEIKTNASYHEKLNDRLSKLPEELAAGVRPAEIAKAMSEAFRQQLAAIGLADTKAFLSAATVDLKKVTRELDATVKPLTDRYGDLAGQIEKQATSIDSQSGKLARTADAINRKHEELLRDIHSLNWYLVGALVVISVFAGIFLGFTWEQRNVEGLIVGLQEEVAQLQQTIKNLAPPPATTTPGRRAKKN